ncbi:MAG: EI24 domain-containing protein [Syntrophobacteraceae bacterium]
MVTGQVSHPTKLSLTRQLAHMIWQEIPRAVLPVLLSVTFIIVGWLTPPGPLITLLSAMIAAVFLAWYSTDIVPARNFIPFRERLLFLRRNLPFHLGFGLCFFIPVLNILLLSFAPVGGTLYHIDLGKRNLANSQIDT